MSEAPEKIREAPEKIYPALTEDGCLYLTPNPELTNLVEYKAPFSEVVEYIRSDKVREMIVEAIAEQRDFLNKMQRLPNVDDIYDEEYLQQRLEEQREICGRAVFKLIMQDGLNPTRPDIAKAVCLNATGESDA